MINVALKPYAEKVYTFDSLTATTNQTAFPLPALSEYNFYLTLTSVTGAASTMDIALQITPDAGTTWFTVARFNAVDSTGPLKQRMRLRPCMGPNDAGGVDLVGDTGGALAVGSVFPGTTARFTITETGTITDFDGTIWLIGNPISGVY